MEPLQTNHDDAFQPGYRPEESYAIALQGLKNFGGQVLVEKTIEGTENFGSAARKNIFLNDLEKRSERETVKQTLQFWVDVLSADDDIAGMIRNCEQQSDAAERLLKKNLKTAIEQTRELETSYRSLALFFLNAETPEIENISFMNASPEQLKDWDSHTFRDKVSEELDENYNRLDLTNNYSLLIVPGYLGSKRELQEWAKIAYKNKVLLVTDYTNFDSPRDVTEEFTKAQLMNQEAFHSNIIMCCNWLVGRGRYEEVGEEEHLFIPPSVAQGGKLYSGLMSQVAAGRTHGVIYGVEGVKFNLKKNEIANLESLGLIPMVKDFGVVMAFSAKTLIKSDNIGMITYSVVRVFDYIAKVLMNYLNQKAFENFTTASKNKMNDQMVKFLNGVTGPKKLIESFTIKRFIQDPVQKDRIYLDILIIPLFPSTRFEIRLDGHNGTENPEWASEVVRK